MTSHFIKSPTPHLKVEIVGPIAFVIVDKQQRRNAFDTEMWRALPLILSEIQAQETFRAIVVRGAGKEAFSAGADISEFSHARATVEGAHAYDAVTEAAYGALRNARLPTIAMIHGFCYGGGLGLAMSCDMRMASATATFAIPAGRLGLAYPKESLRHIVSLVGPDIAKELLFTARTFSAKEALQAGMLNHVWAPDELDGETFKIARQISENAPLSIACAKAVIDDAARRTGQPGNEARLSELIEACYNSADYAEGRLAFAEKRKPVFKGK